MSSQPWAKVAARVHGCLAKDHKACADTDLCNPDTYPPHWLSEEEVREILELVGHLQGNHEDGHKRPQTGPKEPEEQEPEAKPNPEDGADKSDGSGSGETPGGEAAEGVGEEAGNAEGEGASDAEDANTSGALDKLAAILAEMGEKGAEKGQDGKWRPGPITNDFKHEHAKTDAKNQVHVVEAVGFSEWDPFKHKDVTRYQAMCSCGWEGAGRSTSMGAASTEGARHIDQVGGE